MAKPSLSEIYNKLSTQEEYHPATAELFADWSIEAGDKISIGKNGEQYSMPLFSNTITWNGSPKVSIESNGSKEREPISTLSKRKYGSSGGLNTAKEVSLIVQDVDEQKGYMNTYILGEDGLVNTTMWQNRENLGMLAGEMEVDDDGIVHIKDGSGLVIDKNGTSMGVYTEGNLTAGIIVNKINGGTVKISANNIELDGEAVAKSLEAEDLTCGSLASGGSVSGDSLHSYNDIVADENVYAQDFIIGETNLSESIIGVSKSTSGNEVTLTFTKADGKTVPITFSRANPVLDGKWVGNQFQVFDTANPSVNLITETLTPSPTGSTISTFTNHKAYISVGAGRIQGSPLFHWEVDTTNEYENGRTNGWTGAIDSIEVDAEEEITIQSGDSRFIHVKALATKNATAKSTLKTIKVTATGGSGGTPSISVGSYTWLDSSSSQITNYTRMDSFASSYINNSSYHRGYACFTVTVTVGGSSYTKKYAIAKN